MFKIVWNWKQSICISMQLYVYTGHICSGILGKIEIKENRLDNANMEI